MWTRPLVRFVLLAAAASLVAAGCASNSDPTMSEEYVALSGERDSLRDELEQTQGRLDEVDDDLAVAESKLEDRDAEITDLTSQLEAADATSADFETLLSLDLVQRVGMTPDQADCTAAAFIDDTDARSAYLSLLDPSSTSDADARQTAYETVATAFETCGLTLESADAQPTESTAPAVPLADVLGDVTVTGAALPDLPDTGDDPAIGMTAPVVSGADYRGEPVTIDAAADGPTMVIVLAHWCPHCNAEVPRLNQLRDEGRIPEGVQLVAVSSGVSPDRTNYPPDQWIDDVDWTFPVIADGLDDRGSFAGAGAYGTTGFPFVVLIDGDGNVVDRWAGERDINEVERSLIALAG